MAKGSKRLASPEKIAAAAVHLTSDDADYIHAAALHIDGGRVGPSDRHALSGTRTGLLWRNHIGRFVGSVIAASGNSLLATISVRRKIVEEIEPSGRLTNRRSFLLKDAAVGVGAIGAGRLLAHPSPASADWWPHQG